MRWCFCFCLLLLAGCGAGSVSNGPVTLVNLYTVPARVTAGSTVTVHSIIAAEDFNSGIGWPEVRPSAGTVTAIDSVPVPGGPGRSFDFVYTWEVPAGIDSAALLQQYYYDQRVYHVEIAPSAQP